MRHGTGLGLATVSGIVAQSGGEIAVESAPGQGATFRVQFPAAVPEHDGGDHPVAPTAGTPAAGTPTIAPSSRVRQRIVLVEDQDAVRHMTARMLTSDGFDVAQARSAEEAYRFLNDGRDVALVLTDVEMPGVGGGAIARSLERDDRRIPVLFMSGYTNDALLLRGAMPLNASFLAKPFTHELLRAAVRRALDG